MDPLIIIATPNISWLHPEVDYPRTIESLVTEARLCQNAGASILHMHAENHWKEAIRSVRANTNLIVQCGMSSLKIEERMEVYQEKADMISIILNHHDEAFAQIDTHALHPREELQEYAQLTEKFGVLPEFEVWHTGSIWNLKYLIDKGILIPPYVTTLFFGWPGGTWSPPTIGEYLYRRKYMPDKCVVNVSIMGEEQIDILTAAILMGDHVRVGTEDYPFNREGQVATTHELVAEIAQVSKSLGRPIATIKQAQEITGVSGGANV
jgi:3-keto-5-aminohexanoate cleavage enzyme